MRKVILDFREIISQEEISRRKFHEYIAEAMTFPEYYGYNLDALYDCLTDISVPTAVGIIMPEGVGEDWEEYDGADQDRYKAFRYLEKIRKTFADAEMGNPNLAVFDLYHQA